MHINIFIVLEVFKHAFSLSRSKQRFLRGRTNEMMALSISGEGTSDARATTTKGLIGGRKEGSQLGSFICNYDRKRGNCMFSSYWFSDGLLLFRLLSFYDSMNERKLRWTKGATRRRLWSKNQTIWSPGPIFVLFFSFKLSRAILAKPKLSQIDFRFLGCYIRSHWFVA